MNSTPHNPLPAGSVPESGEETLRLIAGLPVPEGIEERVHSALRAAPRGARVLPWPARARLTLHGESGWMRTAAAAAIVFVVVGGGWGVYTRVQQSQPAKVIVMPMRNGFAGAGAKRTPQTLPGPTVSEPAQKREAQAKEARKPAAPVAKHVGQTTSPTNSSVNSAK